MEAGSIAGVPANHGGEAGGPADSFPEYRPSQKTAAAIAFIGDDSVAFDRWRDSWFRGLSQAVATPRVATWPIGLPLLAIDHVWLSKELWPRQAWKETFLGYDHAWQVIEFSRKVR